MEQKFDVREIEFYNVIGDTTNRLDEITGKTFREILYAGCHNILSIRCDRESRYKYTLVDTVDDLALKVMQYPINSPNIDVWLKNKISIEAFHYLLKQNHYNIEEYNFNGRVIYSLVEDGYTPRYESQVASITSDRKLLSSKDTESTIFDFIKINGYFPAVKYLHLEVFLRFLKKYTQIDIQDCCGRKDIRFTFPKNIVFQEDDEEYYNRLLDVAEYMNDCVRFGEFEFEFLLGFEDDAFDDESDGVMWLVEPENKDSARILQSIMNRVYGDCWEVLNPRPQNS